MAENEEIKERENRSEDVAEFAREVYQQCVDKGWSIKDFGLFVTLIKIRKESADRTVIHQLEDAPLPNGHRKTAF